MKHLPQCDEVIKDNIIEDAKLMCEMIKHEDDLIAPEAPMQTASSASEDSPGIFSRRRARVIDLNSSDYFEDIIDVRVFTDIQLELKRQQKIINEVINNISHY